MKIPETLHEITSEWLSQALQSGGLANATVVDCEIQPFPDGFSNAGKLARIQMSYEAGHSGPATVIAKMPDLSKALGPVVAGSHRREIRFYKEIGPNAEVRGEADNPGMHTTRTIDYAIVLSGEIYLKLDEGEMLLQAGDIVVQRATRHGWYNRGDEPCPVAFVLISSPNYR